MIVIGAGMAGLLAASIMRNECEYILEAQESLPANHSAVLRFKSPVVGDTCNIPFKKVKAIKSYVPWKNKIADVMAYSDKTNGDYRLRSIITADGEIIDRYVAPHDFTDRLARSLNCKIKFGIEANPVLFNSPNTFRAIDDPVISTLPMPVLMKMLGWETDVEFKSVAGVNILCRIKNCDMYCSLYVPDPAIGPYRISINGDRMIAEVAFPDKRFREGTLVEMVALWRKQALELLDIPTWRVDDFSYREQKYMKILPIDESHRQRFILWATEKFHVYSLGRFATWRPSLLLDDIIKDVRVIQQIERTGNYEHRKFQGQ